MRYLKIFEDFNDDIDHIKDIFIDLVDKWSMVEDSLDTNENRYSFFKHQYLKTYMNVIDIGKEINNKESVFLIINCDLAGRNNFYTTLYEFNQDCEDLLKRFQSEFECELLTPYGSPYLQSKGISTSRFIFVFKN